MQAIAFLLLTLVALSACSSVSAEEGTVARDLFMVDTTRSEGIPASDKYIKRGFDTVHNSTCSYRLYGTSFHHAAGDRAMRKFSKVFKKRFNRVVKKMEKGIYDPTATRSLLVEEEEQVAEQDLRMVQTEILFQQTRTVMDGMVSGTVGGIDGAAVKAVGDSKNTRKLEASSSGGVQRELLTYTNYNYGLMFNNWICYHCYNDNIDKRRLVQSALVQADFARMVLKDLANSNIDYFTEAVEKANCFQVSCDDGPWVGTEGCNSIVTVEDTQF